MAWRLAKSLETLRSQINSTCPNRNKASDGTIGDAAHSSTVSQHNPNPQGVVTAMDITHDPEHGVNGGDLAEIMIKDPRTWYVIWNSRIWETGVGWQAYYGSNPHSSHIHISTKQDAGSYDNGNNWNIKEEEDMPNSGDVINVYKLINNKVAAQSEVDYYTSKPWNAPDGLYYGKIMVDYKNLQKFLQDAVNSPGKDSDKIRKIKDIVNG